MDKKEFKDRLTELAELKTPETEATLDIEIKKLKAKYAECELGCGELVKNQVIESYRMTFPVDHMRIRCVNCKMCKHPNGKDLIHQNSFQAEYKKFLNNRDK